MDKSPRAAIGFSLVAIAQLVYLIGSLGRGGFGLGSAVDTVSIACAVACAYATWTGDTRRTLAGGLAVLAGIQLAEYARSVWGGELDTFVIGFTLVVAGLVTAAISAWRWTTYNETMPWPVAMRVGAVLTGIGSLSYIALGVLSGFGLGVFSLGALSAAAGWALVAAA